MGVILKVLVLFLVTVIFYKQPLRETRVIKEKLNRGTNDEFWEKSEQEKLSILLSK